MTGSTWVGVLLFLLLVHWSLVLTSSTFAISERTNLCNWVVVCTCHHVAVAASQGLGYSGFPATAPQSLPLSSPLSPSPSLPQNPSNPASKSRPLRLEDRRGLPTDPLQVLPRSDSYEKPHADSLVPEIVLSSTVGLITRRGSLHGLELLGSRGVVTLLLSWFAPALLVWSSFG
jgi:hypothetical protein